MLVVCRLPGCQRPVVPREPPQKRLLETNGQALTGLKQMAPDFLRQSVDVLEVLQEHSNREQIHATPPQ